jgi:hypothetical protein
MRNSLRRKAIAHATALGVSALSAALASPVSAYDVHDYIRWKPNGQLDYRLLLRRYMPVSSFRFGRSSYGYPYSAYGGLLQPYYYYVPASCGWAGNPCAVGAPYNVY